MAVETQISVSVPELLRDVVISKVKPSSISEHPKVLYPCIHDMAVCDVYVSGLCLYRLGDTLPSTFSNFVHAVKDSLSKVLSVYPPNAGKWVVAEDAWIRKLVCDDGGAVFVEAAIDEEMDFYFDPSDFKPPGELLGEFAVPGFKIEDLHKASDNKERPSLIVQVTSFKCGGVVLAIDWNHMTMDGFALDRFLKAWSEIAATGQTSVEPALDRSFLPTHLEPAQGRGVTRDMKNVDDVLADRFRLYPFSGANEAKNQTFSVRKEAVERLRQRAKGEPVAGLLERPERFSTFECIVTQIWRSFSRVSTSFEGMSSEDEVQVTFSVEGRRKWSNPKLPEDYVGNVIVGVNLAPLKATEVFNSTFTLAACKVHERIVTVNPKTSAGLVAKQFKNLDEMASNAKKDVTQSQSNQEISKKLFFVGFTSWIRFENFYSLDFGFGAPYYAAPCVHWGGTAVFLTVILPPRPESGNVAELLIRAPANQLELICQDPEFLDLVS